MTRKRWIAVAGILVSLVGLGAFVPTLLPPRPGVTKANFERIHDGMSQAEVEAIFGSKPLPSPFIWNGCLGHHVET